MSDLNEFDRQLESNRLYFETHREEIQAKYVGKFVALAFGKIVAEGKSSQAVMDQIGKLRPRPLHVEVFPAEAEPLFDILLSPSGEYES